MHLDFKPTSGEPSRMRAVTRRIASLSNPALFGLSVLTVLVWVASSQLGFSRVSGWLPYHVPASIFLSAILLVVVFGSWLKKLSVGEELGPSIRRGVKK